MIGVGLQDSISPQSRGHMDVNPRRRRVPSSRRTLSEQVREEILAGIAAGRWKPGDRLPTQDELIAIYGVSRTPIREAMQSLSTLGVVEISARRGAVVRALPVESVIDMAVLSGSMDPAGSLDDVFVFRHEIEGATAELASLNATEEHVGRLRTLHEQGRQCLDAGDREGFRDLDVMLHAAIAEASGNLVFHAVSRVISGLLVEQRTAVGNIPGASEQAYVEHGAILEAISARDPVRAREVGQAHISRTRSRVEEARALGLSVSP